MWGCSGKLLKSMIYYLKCCWLSVIPQPVSHSTDMIFVLWTNAQWEHLLPTPLFETMLCFSSLPNLFASYLCLSTIAYLTSTSSCVAAWTSALGLRLILSYQLKDQVNDLIWRPDYLIFSVYVAALTHRGRSTEAALINSAGGCTPLWRRNT